MEHVYDYETFTGKKLKANELTTAGKVSAEEELEDEAIKPEQVLLQKEEEQDITEIRTDDTNEKYVFGFNQFNLVE